MAAPSFASATTGFVTTTALLNIQNISFSNIGELFIIQILADGLAAVDPVSATNSGEYEDLAGTVNQLTRLTPAGGHPVGASVAEQHLFAGRVRVSTAFTNIAFDIDGGVDHYGRCYNFSGVNTGSTVAAVLENGTAGTVVNGTGTGTSIADTGVTTLGANRLALQFVAANDDIAIDAFTGMTGGTWAEAVAEFASATGTDGCVQLQTATIAAAGTINGGADTVVTAGWGVIGFALIPPGGGATTYTKAGYGRESL